MTASHPSLRKWSFRVVALIVGCLVGFALTEGVLRVFNLFPAEGLPTVTEDEFGRVPGMFQPGRDVTLRRVGKPEFQVSINSLGYRGPEFPVEKPSGEFRIVMLGDSFTFGDYVNDDESMPAYLQRALGAACGPVHVVNAGLMNTTIDVHMRLAERAMRLRPDLFVLVFYENDIEDLKNPMWNAFARNRAAKSRFPMSVLYPVLRNTATWNLALAVRARRQMQRAFRPTDAPQNGNAAPLDPMVPRLRAAYADSLRRMAAALRRDSVDFVFMAYPAVEEMNGSKADPNTRAMLAAAADAGVRTVDLKPPFVASGLSVNELYLLPLDAHPRPLGHKIAAETAARALAALPALATRCKPDAIPATPLPVATPTR
jgi:hypothetical protein